MKLRQLLFFFCRHFTLNPHISQLSPSVYLFEQIDFGSAKITFVYSNDKHEPFTMQIIICANFWIQSDEKRWIEWKSK